MIDLQVKMMLDEPEVWVPALAVILERYQGNQEATSAVLCGWSIWVWFRPPSIPNAPISCILDTRDPGANTSDDTVPGSRPPRESWVLPRVSGEIWTPGSAGTALRRSGRRAPHPRHSPGRRKIEAHPARPLRSAPAVVRARAPGLAVGQPEADSIDADLNR